jgi:hypothetical protein
MSSSSRIAASGLEMGLVAAAAGVVLTQTAAIEGGTVTIGLRRPK